MKDSTYCLWNSNQGLPSLALAHPHLPTASLGIHQPPYKQAGQVLLLKGSCKKARLNRRHLSPSLTSAVLIRQRLWPISSQRHSAAAVASERQRFFGYPHTTDTAVETASKKHDSGWNVAQLKECLPKEP